MKLRATTRLLLEETVLAALPKPPGREFPPVEVVAGEAVPEVGRITF